MTLIYLGPDRFLRNYYDNENTSQGTSLVDNPIAQLKQKLNCFVQNKFILTNFSFATTKCVSVIIEKDFRFDCSFKFIIKVGNE